MDENNMPIEPEKNFSEYEIPSSPGPEKPKSKKKIFIIAAIAIVAVAIIAIIAGTVLTASPLAILAKGAKNSCDALNNSEIVVLSENLTKGGSIEASTGLESITESMLGYGIDGSAKLKLYFSDAPAAAAVGSIEIGGSSLLDLSVFMSDKETALTSSLLGDSAYGINFDNVGANFDSSVFGPNGAYSLGIELEEIQEVLDSMKTSTASSEEATAILESFAAAALKSIQTHAEIEKGRETVSLAGEECKTTTVSVSADAAAMLNICDDIINYLRSDAELREFITANAGSMASAAGYDSYSAMSPEDMVDSFYEALDEAAEEIENAKAEVEPGDLGFTVTFYISKSGSYLMGAKLTADDYGDTITAECFIGPDFENISEINFLFDDSYDRFEGRYSVKANNDSGYSATLKVEEDGETALSGSIDWNKSSGGLEIEFADKWESYAISCDLKHSSDATVITLNSFEDNGDVYDVGVTLTLRGSDAMPAMPEYTDILTMSEGEIQDLVYDLMATVSELSYLMY